MNYFIVYYRNKFKKSEVKILNRVKITYIKKVTNLQITLTFTSLFYK